MVAIVLTVMGLLLVALIACNAWVIGFSKPYVYDHMRWLPKGRVALVLGTSPYTGSGSENLLFDYRIKAALQLWRHGWVQQLLLSGSNPSPHYNEPQMMYQALARAGVPDSAMTMDFAGFRTLDSVVRAGKVFGLQRYIIVSQRFHNFRAVFIARHKGLDAVAYSWPDEDARQPLHTEAREFLARAWAVLDLFVLHSEPRYLGKPVPIDAAGTDKAATPDGDDKFAEQHGSDTSRPK